MRLHGACTHPPQRGNRAVSRTTLILGTGLAGPRSPWPPFPPWVRVPARGPLPGSPHPGPSPSAQHHLPSPGTPSWEPPPRPVIACGQSCGPFDGGSPTQLPTHAPSIAHHVGPPPPCPCSSFPLPRAFSEPLHPDPPAGPPGTGCPHQSKPTHGTQPLQASQRK